MKIVQISHQDIRDNPENYNSSFHKAHEAPGLEVPTEGPQTFSRWLPLIARSQNIAAEKIQTAILTPAQARLILKASDSSIHTKTLNRVYKEDLEEEIAPVFSSLIFPPNGLFLRLDACSPKDGAGGNNPLLTVDDVILRLTSSLRARNAIDGALRDRTDDVSLYFLPFDQRMATEHEYRVFCAPGEGKVTAVSQYKWHAPSVFQGEESGVVANTIREIGAEIERIHEQILRELGDSVMDRLLLKQGFSFDVM